MQGVNIPKHVGIIMDGNGRWATARGQKRSFGHKEGSANVDKIVTHAFKRGVKALTLYAFSAENWARPKEEVDGLMKLLKDYLKKFAKKLYKSDVRLIVIGGREQLSNDLVKQIEEVEKKSENNKSAVLNIAINYGGRQEIVACVNKLIALNKEITVESISENLYTAVSGEVDLIIRTGGELRLSNFLLYQGAYSELYFTDVLWPDFNEEQFDKALSEFGQRKRRFGKV
ncbi:MAG: di-trans,poly-cis-decaprenylcistransferase [Clostridiales bacterium]|nr:di-trans,poly-cis-decaprenylcistransferase [Clostridiales bacterium]